MRSAVTIRIFFATDQLLVGAQVVYPEGWTEEQINSASAKRGPSKPAKEYPFQLDAFQSISCDCLAR